MARISDIGCWRRGAGLVALLLMLTVGNMWGLTFSFAKAASAAGIPPIAYGFWQTTGAGSVLLLVCLLRRERLSLNGRHLVYYLTCGFFSVAAPNLILQTVIGYVPAGVTAIVVTTVPLLTYLLALAIRLESFASLRALGLLMGFVGAFVLVAPEASLPEPQMTGWVTFGFVAPLLYALGNVYVARRRPGSAALPLAAGMLWGAAFWQMPVVLLTDSFHPLTFPFSLGEWGVIGQIAVTSLASILYFDIMRRAGPVFFSQVAYVVTLSAILWAMAFFGERHSALVWSAALLIACGVAMVNWRKPAPAPRKPASNSQLL